MELLSNPIASQVVSIAVASACGFLAAQVKRMSERDKALYEGIKTVLRKELIDSYERYVVGNEPLSIMRMDEIVRCYEAYKTLGGNGTGEQMFKAIQGVPVYDIYERSGDEVSASR